MNSFALIYLALKRPFIQCSLHYLKRHCFGQAITDYILKNDHSTESPISGLLMLINVFRVLFDSV